METDQNKILNRAIYPGLYVLAFVSYKSARYLPSFSIITAAAVVAMLLVIAASLQWLSKKIFRSAFTGLIPLILLFSLLHIAAVAQLFGYSYAYISTGFYVLFYSSVIVLVVVAGLLLRRVPSAYAPIFNRLLNIFLLIISIVFISEAAIKHDWSDKDRKRRSNHPAAAINGQKKKDIVWLLLDEYGSSEALAKQFGFTNPLDSQLARQGYTVLPQIRTRFTNTLFSLNAIFNEDDSVPPSSYYAGISSLRNGLWQHELEQAGYQFINLGIFDIGTHPKLEDRSGYPDTYLEQVTSGTIFNVIANKLKYNIPESDRYDNKVMRMLSDTLHAKSAQPKFIWAHVSIPHAPFCRNSHGELQVRSDFDENDSAAIGGAYIGYLSYGNGVLNRFIQGHPELAQKIVVISGDHGPRYPFLKDKSYQNWPFAAVHFPGPYDSTALHRLRYISQIPAFIIHYLAGN